MTVDIMVPVYGPDEKLGRLVYMMNRQNLRPDKLVLMVTLPEGNSPEMEKARISGWTEKSKIPVEYHFLSRDAFDHGGTRNAGMAFCDSDLVICMTQDAVPEDDHMVEELIAPFSGEQKVIISYARQMPARDCKPVEAYTRGFNYPSESRVKTASDIPVMGIKTFFASNVCAAYKKELFLKQGGFPEKTIFNEDMIFAGRAVKAGYAVAYAAGARVIHSHNLSNKEQFKRNFDLAVSQAENPDVFAGIRSESEGIRLVKKTMGYLLRSGKGYLIPGMVFTSACKYTGFLLGKRYKKLPKKLVRAFSLNKRYWRDR